MNLKDKVILLTGAGKGIGREVLESSIKNGAYVYAVTKSKKIENYKRLEKYKDKFKIFFFDVKNTKNFNRIFLKSLKDNRKINCLINNAGIRQRKNFLKISKFDLKKVFDINFASIFFLNQIFIKYLLKNNLREASVVNIGSIVGHKGFIDLSGYASTKTALSGLTKCLAVEYAKKNYRFNIVSPGFTKTSYFEKFKKNKKLFSWTKSKIPMSRWGKSSEISSLINFLISNDSKYITGQEIFIDGGWTII